MTAYIKLENQSHDGDDLISDDAFEETYLQIKDETGEQRSDQRQYDVGDVVAAGTEAHRKAHRKGAAKSTKPRAAKITTPIEPSAEVDEFSTSDTPVQKLVATQARVKKWNVARAFAADHSEVAAIDRLPTCTQLQLADCATAFEVRRAFETCHLHDLPTPWQSFHATQDGLRSEAARVHALLSKNEPELAAVLDEYLAQSKSDEFVPEHDPTLARLAVNLGRVLRMLGDHQELDAASVLSLKTDLETVLDWWEAGVYRKRIRSGGESKIWMGNILTTDARKAIRSMTTDALYAVDSPVHTVVRVLADKLLHGCIHRRKQEIGNSFVVILTPDNHAHLAVTQSFWLWGSKQYKIYRLQRVIRTHAEQCAAITLLFAAICSEEVTCTPSGLMKASLARNLYFPQRYCEHLSSQVKERVEAILHRRHNTVAEMRLDWHPSEAGMLRPENARDVEKGPDLLGVDSNTMESPPRGVKRRGSLVSEEEPALERRPEYSRDEAAQITQDDDEEESRPPPAKRRRVEETPRGYVSKREARDKHESTVVLSAVQPESKSMEPKSPRSTWACLIQ